MRPTHSTPRRADVNEPKLAPVTADDQLLAALVIDCCANAARAWARGDETTAITLTRAARRIIGTDTFIDTGPA